MRVAIVVLLAVVSWMIFESILAILVINSKVDAAGSETLVPLRLRVCMRVRDEVLLLLIVIISINPRTMIIFVVRVSWIERKPSLRHFEFVEIFNSTNRHKLIVALRLTLILSECVR